MQGYPQPYGQPYGMMPGPNGMMQGQQGKGGQMVQAGPGMQPMPKTKKNKKKNQDQKLAPPKPQVSAPAFDSSADFPALPASPGTEKKVGYTGPYKAYNADEIAEIVSKLGPAGDGVVESPDCIPADSVCKAPQANITFESFAAAAAAAPVTTQG